MKKIFISGATGYIGQKLSLRLAEEGHEVHALYRSEGKAKSLKHKNIKLFKGDLMNPESLKNATKDCQEAYHVAAFASVWTRDPSLIYHLNIEGAMNVIHACMEAGIRKIVITSTAGVFGPSRSRLLDETAVASRYFIDYEHSKAILETIVKTFSRGNTELCMVNPSRVFGPGLLSESNGVTRMIKKYVEGKWRIIPGTGNSMGNYVFIDDVVQGHILAMEKGISGEKYILGGENISYNQFFRRLGRLNGKACRLFHLPLFLMLGFAHLMMIPAVLFRIPPLITPALARKFNMNFQLSDLKARKELGYEPLSFDKGLEKTLIWIKNNY